VRGVVHGGPPTCCPRAAPLPGPPPPHRPRSPAASLGQPRLLPRRRTAPAHPRQRPRLAPPGMSGPGPPTSGPPRASGRAPTRCACGGGAGPEGGSTPRAGPGGGVRPPSPPRGRALVAALARERVAQTRTPLSRQSLGGPARAARAGLGRPSGRAAAGRILGENASKPRQYEHRAFPRAPDSFAKAARVPDL
jgi:hypothetical protein